MRTDACLATRSAETSPVFQSDPFTNQRKPEIDERYTRGRVDSEQGSQWHSFSGHERNCLFTNQDGKSFRDDSLISGVDNEADGRAFVVWDYDHDGRNDLALVNANYPLLNIYRNQLPTNETANAHFVALRFTGANTSATTHSNQSARDAYGARVVIECGARHWLREHRCGEGFAAQNSATMLIGLGEHAHIDRLTVTWPSGREQSWQNLPTDKLIEVTESAAGDEEPVRVVDYLSPNAPIASITAPREPMGGSGASSSDMMPTIPLSRMLKGTEIPHDRPYYLLTTTATWCEACVRSQPQLQRLSDRFRDTGRMELLGIPADPIESPRELRDHAQKTGAVYRVLADIAPEDRDTIVNYLRESLDTESIPCSVLLDGHGRIVASFLGVPTLSEVGRAMSTQQSNAPSIPTQ